MIAVLRAAFFQRLLDLILTKLLVVDTSAKDGAGSSNEEFSATPTQTRFDPGSSSESPSIIFRAPTMPIVSDPQVRATAEEMHSALRDILNGIHAKTITIMEFGHRGDAAASTTSYLAPGPSTATK